MNTDTGFFENSDLAPAKANRYSVGQIVSLDGDDYEVLSLGNVDGRGRILLCALSRSDHEARLDEIAKMRREDFKSPPHRAARREQERSLKLEGKRRMKGSIR